VRVYLIWTLLTTARWEFALLPIKNRVSHIEELSREKLDMDMQDF
jgi:hypothetical protein